MTLLFLQRRHILHTLLLVSLLYSLLLTLAYFNYAVHSNHKLLPTNLKYENLAAARKISRRKNFMGNGRSNNSSLHSYAIVHNGYINLLEGKPLEMHCPHCAIVTGSGHLINSSAGKEIDQTPCVFRMNNSPVRGYEKDVGSYTTLRSFGHVNLEKSFSNNKDAYDEMLTDNGTRADVVLINWMSKLQIKKLESKEYRFAVLLAHVFPQVKFYTFTMDKMIESEELFKFHIGMSRKEARTWLSTGWYTLLAAMDICQDITVYGMANENYCTDTSNLHQNVPYHYYEPDKLKECSYYNRSETRLTGGHLFITEKAIFAQWATKRNITFKYPTWPVNKYSPFMVLDTPFLKHYRKHNNKTREEPRLHRPVAKAGGDYRVQLKLGNKTITVDKEHFMDDIIRNLPHAKVLLGPKNYTEIRNFTKTERTLK